MKILLLIPILFMVGCASNEYKYTKMFEEHKNHYYKEKKCGFCNRTT